MGIRGSCAPPVVPLKDRRSREGAGIESGPQPSPHHPHLESHDCRSNRYADGYSEKQEDHRLHTEVARSSTLPVTPSSQSAVFVVPTTSCVSASMTGPPDIPG